MFAAVSSSLIIKLQVAILRLEDKTIYVFVTQNVSGNKSKEKKADCFFVVFI